MYPYKSLTKAQLIELLNLVESTLDPALHAANLAGKEYSPEIKSQMAFEIGHLSGSIKHVLGYIHATKNC